MGRIANLNLHDDSSRHANLAFYHHFCAEACGLHVTTSCFEVWKKNQWSNGYAKVVPAVRVEDRERPIRVFFFDDNLEWDGQEQSHGICNLRDVTTGDFVNFTDGENGFLRDSVGRHTVVHHSTDYCNVLVKANILDALKDPNYFTNIIQRYAQPGEKLVVLMDVNSTIMCKDTCAGKDVRSTLLSAMFELVEVRSFKQFQVEWEDKSVTIERSTSLKQLVKDLTVDDNAAYSAFWNESNCRHFLKQLAISAELSWSSRAETLSTEEFWQYFHAYLEAASGSLTEHGLIRSWFSCFSFVELGGHVVILNTFGVDAQKVVSQTVSDESRVMHLAVNYELWGKRDTHKFESEYREQSPRNRRQLIDG